MQSNSLKKGFTLPEVLVGMSVMVLVVISATNLLVSSIRSNVTNINTLVAYGLAQEGLEAVRNIRDSDWLLGASFNGTAGKSAIRIWGEELPSLRGQVKYFTVDSRQSVSPLSPVRPSLSLAGAAPWKLEALTLDDINKGLKTLLYKQENVPLKEIRYSHSHSRMGKATPYHRYITVSPVVYPLCPLLSARCFKKMRVSSTVEWVEFGMKKQVRLDTELTDWKNK